MAVHLGGIIAEGKEEIKKTNIYAKMSEWFITRLDRYHLTIPGNTRALGQNVYDRSADSGDGDNKRGWRATASETR